MEAKPEAQRTKRSVTSGPISKQVRGNINRLRGKRSQQWLADRLTEMGHPMLPGAILKIEKGTRRVDVDDLVAFALALDVNPSALLLPPVADGTSVGLTSAVIEPAVAVWEWADGDYPLPSDVEKDAVKQGTEGEVDADELNASYEAFRVRVRPGAALPSDAHPAVQTATELLRWVKSFVHDPLPTFGRHVRARMDLLSQDIDNLEGQS